MPAFKTVDLPITALGLLLYYGGLAPLVIWLRRRSPRVLIFHAIEDEESDFIRGLSINTHPAQFAAQLEFLKKHYRIVPLSAYREEVLPERALVITFDDGFRSVYQHAFPILKAGRIPATCYLNTDTIGNRSMIWLNELTWFLHRHPLRAGPIVSAWLGSARPLSRAKMIVGLIAGYDRRGIAALLDELRRSIGIAPGCLAREACLYLDRQEIEEMAQNGITFGNHSASHAVLSRLSEEECRQELSTARDALQNLPGSIPSLAYPFGSWNKATRRIAIELGCTTLLDVEGLNHPMDPLNVGRLNVTSISPAVLFARMELVAPLRFCVKRLLLKLRRRPQSG